MKKNYGRTDIINNLVDLDEVVCIVNKPWYKSTGIEYTTTGSTGEIKMNFGINHHSTCRPAVQRTTTLLWLPPLIITKSHIETPLHNKQYITTSRVPNKQKTTRSMPNPNLSSFSLKIRFKFLASNAPFDQPKIRPVGNGGMNQVKDPKMRYTD